MFIQKIQLFHPIKFLITVESRVPTWLHPKFWGFVVEVFLRQREISAYSWKTGINFLIPTTKSTTSPPFWFNFDNLVSLYNGWSLCNCFIPLCRFKFLNWALCFSQFFFFKDFLQIFLFSFQLWIPLWNYFKPCPLQVFPPFLTGVYYKVVVLLSPSWLLSTN